MNMSIYRHFIFYMYAYQFFWFHEVSKVMRSHVILTYSWFTPKWPVGLSVFSLSLFNICIRHQNESLNLTLCPNSRAENMIHCFMPISNDETALSNNGLQTEMRILSRQDSNTNPCHSRAMLSYSSNPIELVVKYCHRAIKPEVWNKTAEVFNR